MAIALVIAGCGSSNSLPSGAVVSVAGNTISQRAYAHWLYVDAKGNAEEEPGEPVIIPDPPKYTKCSAQLKSGFPTLAKATAATLKKDCAEVFQEYSPQVLDFLIKAYWYQAEAHKQGITITDAQVAKALAKAKKSEFKTASAFTSFLKESGQTVADISYRVRVNQIFDKLIAKHKTKVTDADITSYYNSHKSSYGTPERRDMRIVLAKTQAKALAAKKALQSGASWTTVAKQYSIDPTTKNKGGVLTDVTKGQQDATLSKAAFAAKPYTLVGPIKDSFGYYLVEVTKVLPSTQKTLAQSKAKIKQTLTSQATSTAEKAVEKAAQADFKGRTVCAKLYSMTDCPGYKAPATTTTSAATATSGAATSSSATTTSSSASASSTTKSSTTSSTTSSQ